MAGEEAAGDEPDTQSRERSPHMPSGMLILFSVSQSP